METVNPGTNCSLNAIVSDFDINICRLETLTRRAREEAPKKNPPTRAKIVGIPNHFCWKNIILNFPKNQSMTQASKAGNENVGSIP